MIVKKIDIKHFSDHMNMILKGKLTIDGKNHPDLRGQIIFPWMFLDFKKIDMKKTLNNIKNHSPGAPGLPTHPKAWGPRGPGLGRPRSSGLGPWRPRAGPPWNLRAGRPQWPRVAPPRGPRA